MMLLYVAWMAIWQAVYDPCPWIGAGERSNTQTQHGADYGHYAGVRAFPGVPGSRRVGSLARTNPAISCCGEADAFEADSFEVHGDQYVAITR